MTRRTLLFFWLGWLLLTIYGSLLPFEPRGTSWDSALRLFSSIRYLELGLTSRADWIANILLYLPGGYLGMVLWGRRPVLSPVGLVVSLLVLAGCVLLAVGVEFAQLFIRPRTVSQNDLIAELLGGALGIALWIVAGETLSRLLRQTLVGGHLALNAGTLLYGFLYLGLALFPFDFVVSIAELEWKLAHGTQGWLLAGSAYGYPLRCAITLVIEIALTVPLGLLLYCRYPRTRVGLALAVGLGLGLAIEAIQLLLVSGVAQGMSIVTRGIGMALGWLTMRHIDLPALIADRRRLAPLLYAALPLYVVLIVTLIGWFSMSWQGLDEALAAFAKVSWLPFYYHYYTTEVIALRSLLMTATLYAPIALFWWILRDDGIEEPVVLTLVFVFIVEFSKLFLTGGRPDPTNLLIATGAAALFATFLRFLSRFERDHRLPENRARDSALDAEPRVSPWPQLHAPSAAELLTPHRVLALAIWFAGLVWVLDFPYGTALLPVLMLAWAWLMVRPTDWPIVTLLGLALLNMSPWTGRLLFDAFDQLLLVVTGSLIWRLGPRTEWRPPRELLLLVGLLVGSHLLALMRGISGDTGMDALAGQLGNDNGLRVGKGLVWALLLIGLSGQDLRTDFRPAIWRGVVLALSGVSLLILIERHWYPGLWDFDQDYRVTASFFAMATGGAYLDGFLASAVPLLLLWRPRAWSSRVLLYGAIWPLICYGVLVTFSRGLYLALIMALGVYALGRLAQVGGRRFSPRGLVIAASVLLLLSIVVQGGYLKNRFSTVQQDFVTRLEHWRGALSLLEKDPIDWAFGLGLGSFPAHKLSTQSTEYRKVPLSLGGQTERRYLRLGSGRPLWLDQRLYLAPGEYRIEARIRAHGARWATLHVAYCKKSLLYALDCQRQALRVEGNTNWQVLLQPWRIDKAYTGSTTITLANSSPGTLVDLKSIRLVDGNGVDQLKNPRFSQGMDHWFISADDHLSWHLKNLYVQQLFEQGVLGLAVFLALALLTLWRCWVMTRQGDPFAPAWSAALVGLLSVGLIDSLFDDPRISLLYWLLLFSAWRIGPIETVGTPFRYKRHEFWQT